MAWQQQVERGGRAAEGGQPGPPPGAFERFGRSLLVSMTALFFETVVVVLCLMAYNDTQERPNADGGGSAFGMALGVPCGALFGLLVSVTLVLPLVNLGFWLGRRFGGRDAWWWTPAVAAAAAAVLVPAAWLPLGAGLAETVVAWLTATAYLAVAALAVRPVAVRPKPADTGFAFLITVLVGLTAAVAVTGLGAAATATGVVTSYVPPQLSRTEAVGVWSDGKGGTLRLDADGTATARGVDEYDGFEDRQGECSGAGAWSYDEGLSAWSQAVDVSISACALSDWNVGGTPGRATLYSYRGDPDSGDTYVLRRAPGK